MKRQVYQSENTDYKPQKNTEESDSFLKQQEQIFENQKNQFQNQQNQQQFQKFQTVHREYEDKYQKLKQKAEEELPIKLYLKIGGAIIAIMVLVIMYFHFRHVNSMRQPFQFCESYSCPSCTKIVNDRTTSPYFSKELYKKHVHQLITQAIVKRTSDIVLPILDGHVAPQLTDLGVIMASLQYNLEEKAHIVIGKHKTWEGAIKNLLQEIIILNKKEVPLNIKIDFIGNFNKSKPGKIINIFAENDYYLRNDLEHHTFQKTFTGLFVYNTFLPIETNSQGFIVNQSEHAMIDLALINDSLKLIGRKPKRMSIPYIIDYEYLTSFVWIKPKQYQINNTSGNNIIISKNHVKSLYRNNVLFKNQHELTEQEISYFLDINTQFILQLQDFNNKNKYFQHYLPQDDIKLNADIYEMDIHLKLLQALIAQYKRKEQQENLQVIENMIQYVINNLVECPNTYLSTKCIVDEHQLVRLRYNGQFLLILCEYKEITNNNTQYEGLMLKLANRIIEMQDLDTGDFKHHRVSESGNFLKQKGTITSTGMALYGLITYYKFNQEEVYLHAVDIGLKHLIKDIKSKYDQYVLYTINQYTQFVNDDSLVQFVKKLTNQQLKEFNDEKKNRYPDFQNIGIKFRNDSYKLFQGLGGLLQSWQILNRNNIDSKLQNQIIEYSNDLIKYTIYLQSQIYNSMYYKNPKNAIGGVKVSFKESLNSLDINSYANISVSEYLIIKKGLGFKEETVEDEDDNYLNNV